MNRKTTCAALVLIAGVALSGCSSSVPDCDDPDVKELVINIAVDNERDDTLEQLNMQIERLENANITLQSELQVAMTADERKAEIARLKKDLNDINIHIGIPLNKYNVSHSEFDEHGWAGRAGWGPAGRAQHVFANAYADSDIATLERLNKHVGLHKDNRSQNVFNEASRKHGWQGTKYANGGDALNDYESMRKRLVKVSRLNVADEKQRVGKHNAEINKKVDKNQAEIDGYQGAIEYVKSGELSVMTIRTTRVDEESDNKQCEAALHFTHSAKKVKTDIEYTVALTADDEIYVKVRGLGDVYGLRK